MDIPILKDIIIIFVLSIFVLLICLKLKIPNIVGFIITGVLAGPQGLKLISAVDEVKVLAEIGIILLLFTVGLEVSVKRMLKFKRFFFIAGPVQVFLTILCGSLVALVLGRGLGESIFLGFLLSLSSTAIVLRILQEKRELNSPQGQLVFSILIFQDIIVIPMMLFIPILAGKFEGYNIKIIYLIFESIVLLLTVFIVALKLVPKLMFYIAKTKSRELFLLAVLVICLGIAWLTSLIGLSLALGAFLAGFIISQSEYSTRAVGDIIPLHDIFTSFFFVSIGMLLDFGFFLNNIAIIVLISGGLFLLKTLIVILTAAFLKMPLRPAIIAGLTLAQVGEFSFVLAQNSLAHDLGTEFLHKLFLAVAVITMGATPIIIAYSHKIAEAILKLPLPKRVMSRFRAHELESKVWTINHLIIIGSGYSGKKLAKSASKLNIPYLIIDLNPENIMTMSKAGEPIFFGDATRETVVKNANVEKAKVVAVVVSDVISCQRIVENIRRINSDVHIIVRIQYVDDMQLLYNMGANEVVSDELESCEEILTRVITKFNIQNNNLENLIEELFKDERSS